jgi:CBS-domain-containing membrane protein
MEALAALAREPLIRVPFVTSVVLVMALPASDPARARAVIGGHLLSSLAGWLVLGMAGTSEPAAAAAVGLATLVMIATRTLHPPAGLDAFLMTSQNLPAIWIFNPVLIGAVLLTVFAAAWHAGERRLRLGPG